MNKEKKFLYFAPSNINVPSYNIQGGTTMGDNCDKSLLWGIIFVKVVRNSNTKRVT